MDYQYCSGCTSDKADTSHPVTRRVCYDSCSRFLLAGAHCFRPDGSSKFDYLGIGNPYPLDGIRMRSIHHQVTNWRVFRPIPCQGSVQSILRWQDHNEITCAAIDRRTYAVFQPEQNHHPVPKQRVCLPA